MITEASTRVPQRVVKWVPQWVAEGAPENLLATFSGTTLAKPVFTANCDQQAFRAAFRAPYRGSFLGSFSGTALGTYHVFMETGATRRKPVECHGSLRNPKEPYEALWRPVTKIFWSARKPNRAPWCLLQPFEALWIPTEPHGALWSPAKPCNIKLTSFHFEKCFCQILNKKLNGCLWWWKVWKKLSAEHLFGSGGSARVIYVYTYIYI